MLSDLLRDAANLLEYRRITHHEKLSFFGSSTGWCLVGALGEARLAQIMNGPDRWRLPLHVEHAARTQPFSALMGRSNPDPDEPLRQVTRLLARHIARNAPYARRRFGETETPRHVLTCYNDESADSWRTREIVTAMRSLADEIEHCARPIPRPICTNTAPVISDESLRDLIATTPLPAPTLKELVFS